MQGLQLKLNPPGPEFREQWNLDDLQVLERFFEARVMAIPFKPNAIQAFGRLLNAPFRILRDLVQIIKLEMLPAFAQQYQLKWSVQFCLTVPPSAPSIVPVGSASVLTARNKMLFFLHIRRLGMSPESEGASVILPLVYDLNTNVTQLAERRDANTAPGSGNPVAQTASMMLKRFYEYNAMQADCSIFACIRELLTSLTLPNEPPSMNAMQQPTMNVPMGLGSGPQVGVPGMSVALGPGTPGMMQMQSGPMGVGMGMQQNPGGQVNMPIQSPMSGYGPVPGAGMGQGQPVMSIGNMGPMSNMGQQGPGGMM